MNVVIWARVSSREQREGYSIDAQLRACRIRAEREGWKAVKEFAVAESAKRGAERVAFNQMFDWVRKNAKKEGIQAILSHKLDRACRNMRDAVRLQELEDTCGIKLAFVENQFGPGAAGMLSFNVMAAVAQYYSDNLRSEVMKGQDEKVLQGWLPCGVPYGYMNVKDREKPIQLQPDRAATVRRIFDLYGRGGETFETVSDRLAKEGHVYRQSCPRFTRNALSYILNNRFYIGEVIYRGKTFAGKHETLVDTKVFQKCQDILHGKVRHRPGGQGAPLAGGTFRCSYCGQSLTGETIRRPRKDGSIRLHSYYRCANNHREANHPAVRWRTVDIETAVAERLDSLKLPPKVSEWFRESLTHVMADRKERERQQQASLTKRRTELENMQERLLNAYLAGTIDEVIYQAKAAQLKNDLGEITKSLVQVNVQVNTGTAVALFDWTQRAGETWRGSNIEDRRRMLNSICLNRTASDTSLCLEWRRPFSILAERPSVQPSRGERI